MLRKVKKLWNILKFFVIDEDNLLLHLIELKARESLWDCASLGVSSTEDIEDLIFHLQAYYSISDVIAATKYPYFKGVNISKMMKNYKKGNAKIKDVVEFAEYNPNEKYYCPSCGEELDLEEEYKNIKPIITEKEIKIM